MVDHARNGRPLPSTRWVRDEVGPLLCVEFAKEAANRIHFVHRRPDYELQAHGFGPPFCSDPLSIVLVVQHSVAGYLTEDVLTELTRSVLLGRSVKLGILTDRPTDRGSQASYRTDHFHRPRVPNDRPTKVGRYSRHSTT